MIVRLLKRFAQLASALILLQALIEYVVKGLARLYFNNTEITGVMYAFLL